MSIKSIQFDLKCAGLGENRLGLKMTHGAATSLTLQLMGIGKEAAVGKDSGGSHRVIFRQE